MRGRTRPSQLSSWVDLDLKNVMRASNQGPDPCPILPVPRPSQSQFSTGNSQGQKALRSPGPKQALSVRSHTLVACHGCDVPWFSGTCASGTVQWTQTHRHCYEHDAAGPGSAQNLFKINNVPVTSINLHSSKDSAPISIQW